MNPVRRSRISVILALMAALVAAAMALPASAGAAWGDLDPTFGGDGIVNPTGALNQPIATAFQPDGKLLVTGAVVSGASQSVYVSRLNLDGSPDTGFGTGGTFTFTSLPVGADSIGWALRVQPDGKIVVAGAGEVGSNDSALLIRLTSTGALDTGAFGGGNGYVLAALGFSESFFYDIDFIGTDIVAGGTYHADASHVRPLIRRYSANGTPDSAYNTQAATSLSGFSMISDEDNVGVGITPAGNAIVAFTIYDSGLSTHFAKAVRLTSVGGLDFTYGSSAVATLPGDFAFNAEATAADGSITLVGGKGSGYNITVVGRITPGGTPDPGFGTGGVFANDMTPTSRNTAMNVGLMPDGRAMLLILSFTPDTKPFTSTAVVTQSGGLLSTYGANGLHAYGEFGAQSYPYGLALRSDGSAAIAGAGTSGVDQVPFAAKLKPEFEPAPPIVPTSTIKSPSKKKIKAKSSKKFSGTAGPAGQISKVEIALQRVDSKLLKKKKRCLWLSSSKAKFKTVKAVKKKCSKQRWLKASGTSKWSYRLKKRLPKGSYVLQVRAIATDGSVQAKPTSKKFKVT